MGSLRSDPDLLATKALINSLTPSVSFQKILQARYPTSKPFVRQWLNGTLRGDVMWRPSDVRSFLSNYFHSEMQNTETTTLRIWVSHDYSIAVMRELLFGANVEAEPWISYLDGLVLMYDSNDKMLANWNGNNAPVPEFRATGAPE